MRLRPVGICAALLAAVTCVVPAVAEETLPDSSAGRALGVWLEVVRSGETEAAREHFEQSFAESFRSQVGAEPYLGLVGQLRGLLAGVELAPIREESEYALSAWFKSPQAGWLQILLHVQPEAPHRIETLLVRPGEPPAEGDGGAASVSLPAGANLSELLELARDEGGFPAIAAARVKGGKLVDTAVVGVRAAGGDDPVTVGDRFHIGSVTKSVTATMIGRLVEQGKIDWTTTVAEAFDEFEMHDAYRSVTLLQLLQHQGS